MVHDNGIIIGGTVFYTFLSILALLLGDILLAKYDPRVSFTNERG
jgi:oligopeptide transport system permease protein